MFLKVILSFALCYGVGILPAGAEISNHQIFYRQDKRAPLTKIEIVFLGAGSNQEQPAQIELASTVSKLILESAKNQGHIDQLTVLGTDLSVFPNTTSLTVSASTLSENCAESIEIIRDVIYNFDFSESDLDKVKKQRVVYYQHHLMNKSYIYLRHFAFSETKVRKTYKPLKILKNLSAKDVRQYYARLLKTEVVFFKTISNRDSTEVAKLLRPIIEDRENRPRRQADGFVDSLISPPFKILSDRDSTEIAKLFRPIQAGGFVHSFVPPAIDHHFGPSVFVLDSNLKNIWCYWLIPYGSIEETNYIPSMISLVLGRYGARGLLYKYFREELGLVYGIGSDDPVVQYIRFLKIYADPQLQNSEELIRKMSDFIRGLPDNPRFWEGIKELRENSNIAYAHVHERLTPQQRLNGEVYRAIYDIPGRKGGSKSITDAEIRAYLEKFFVPENMVMMFIGPKDNIIEILNANWPEVEVQVQSFQSLQNFLK